VNWAVCVKESLQRHLEATVPVSPLGILLNPLPSTGASVNGTDGEYAQLTHVTRLRFDCNSRMSRVLAPAPARLLGRRC
jgi:hypothetical protein